MSDWDPAPDEEVSTTILNGRSTNAPEAKFQPNDTAANAKLIEDSEWSKIKPQAYNYLSTTAGTAEERDKAAREAQQADLNALRSAQLENPEGVLVEVPLWAHAASKYEWKDEYGDVGPKVPELEAQLFNDQFLQRPGENFSDMQAGCSTIRVTVESETEVIPILSWENAGLHPVMLDNIRLCKYKAPTAIQGYCLPAILTNRDVVAISQTGSGKTAAFLIPILSKLMGKVKKLAARRPAPDEDPFMTGIEYRAEPLVLIVVPTRELAVQIFDDARRLCYRSMLRPCVAYGGGPRRDQLKELKRGCDVLIGTPGRILDFMNDGGVLSMSRVRYTVLDEADELVKDDWTDDIKAIMTGGDNNQDADHRYMMFSATFPPAARTIVKKHLTEDYIRFRVGRIGSTHRNVDQTVIWCEENRKQQCLFDLIISVPPTRTLIFVNSRKTADFLDDFLYNNGLPSTSIHSERTQREREDSLRGFKSGKTPLLVATGVSARGWDIWNVMHVINYDLPSGEHAIEDYVHRIGRTARIGNRGKATSFYNDRNENIRDDLIKILLESGQALPDFFEEFRPADGELNFDDNSDEEAQDDGAGGSDDWNTGDTTGSGDAAGPGSGTANMEDGW